MVRRWILWAAIFAVIFGGFSSVSATPTKIVAGIVSKVVSALVSWISSINSTPKTALSTRSMIKFEAGHIVETVFDGSKLGIEPYFAAVSPSGELLILDAENSNIHKISMPFYQFCRPKLFAGSSEGHSGHVDGKLRDARMSHPKGLTVDDRGNIYIADTKNMAIRKISNTGIITTIAGGKWRRSGHVDGPSEDAKFSNDFDVVYVGSTCSLLVIDRGNQAIRELQLRPDDCTDKYDGSFLLGMAVLTAAGFFGYMLARLQWRVLAMFSSKNLQDSRTDSRKGSPLPPNQRPQKSVNHPFIPSEEEYDQPGENLICSLGKLFLTTGSSAAEIFVGLFLRTRRQPALRHTQHHYRHHHLPPATATKPYPYMATRLEKPTHFRQGWDGNGGDERRWERPQEHDKRWVRNEVVFGEVQEEERVDG